MSRKKHDVVTADIILPLATLQRIDTADAGAARAFVGDGPILSDDRPVIEYFLSLPKHDAPGGYTGPISAFEGILTP